MTLLTALYSVLLKFKPDVSQEHRDTFVREMKAVRQWPHVKCAFLGEQALTGTASFSKDYEYGFVSFHEDQAALERYRALGEHERYGDLAAAPCHACDRFISLPLLG
jgi:hypothetical protein